MPGAELIFPPYRLDTANEQLHRDRKRIPIRAKPFALLRYMAENPGRLVTHEELRKAIWGATYVSEGVLRVYLREVRAALGDDAESPRFIETIARRGYRFLVPVEGVSAPASAAGAQVGAWPASAKPVGRDVELLALGRAFDKASSGMRQLVLLGGEAGIGKSTLIELFLAGAVERSGVWIARGQCVEHRGESEPYLPVIDALERLCQTDARALELLHKHAPSWLAQMPALTDQAVLRELRLAVQGATQQRMLREMAMALEHLARHHPLVLAFEDLHWSDPSTLTLIDLIARRAERARLFVIGTHRPAASLSSEHPLRALLGELAGRYCESMTLRPFEVTEIAQYLKQRIPWSENDGVLKVARRVHRRTGGNPLFVAALVETLLTTEPRASGDAGGARWFEALAEQSERVVPATVLEMIAHQFARLSPGDQSLLETASVAGAEFSTAAVAAGAETALASVEGSCAALAKRMSFLQECGDAEWPDGTVAARFRFQHALYREAVYGKLSGARRLRLHQQIGTRKELGYGARSAEIAAELAAHFEQARDFGKALHYREHAAQNALRRSAPREATEHLTAALAMLDGIADGAERSARELRLRLALGAALQSTRGYGAPEVEQAYERAGELCRRLGETPQLFPALMGLWSFAVGRGEWKRASAIAERNLGLAQSVQEPALLARSWRALAHGQLFLGELREARDNFQKAIDLCGPSSPPLDALAYTSNTEVDARSALAWTLDLMGLSDQALAAIGRALGAAERLSNAHDLIYATYFATVLYGFRREWSEVKARAQRTIQLADEHGLPYYQVMGAHMQAVAAAQTGDAEPAAPTMRHCIEASRAMGVEAGLTGMLLMAADACRLSGQYPDGLAAIEQAFEFVKSKGEQAWAPELIRVKGELLLEQHCRGEAARARIAEKQAEECFRESIGLARSQGARKWELRAAMSFASLLKHQKRKKEGRQLLSEAYARFEEGFRTRDLQDAKAQIDELA